MPLIQVLSQKEQATHENVPTFTGNERKHFLSLPASLQIKVNTFPSLTNKVGFRLMFGYFLATKRIYPTEQFNQKDIQYLCNQYAMMPFAFDAAKYKASTFSRYRQIILEHFAFQSYQPRIAAIPLSEILSTVDATTSFVEHFEHLQPLYRKRRPDKSLFFAGITAFGCNLGIPTMVKAASQVRSSQLENATNWYFNLANINKANDAISNFTAKLPLAHLYLKKEGELRTSSDGQKIRLISENTIFADYSAKYYRKGRGVVAYTFVDERCIPFYSVIIDASLREAIYVLDGLLHNDTIKSTMHTTDTHGYTEALFGLTDLLNFGFCPNIAKVLRQHIYTFKEHPISQYKQKGYLVLPKGYIDEALIEENWNEVLRIITSLKLKYCTASQLFSRFNSYSKQHPLYAALKEYGRVAKTLHILRFTDDLEMRQDSRKSGNAIESSNRFSSAIFFANGGEMIYLTRTEQQIADACKNLIKNAIVCWNYLYLTRKIQQAKNPGQRDELISMAKQKTMNAWRHVHLAGTYDFSDEKLADSFNLLYSKNYALNLN